jgi:carboxyl-terminal processing protease
MKLNQTKIHYWISLFMLGMLVFWVTPVVAEHAAAKVEEPDAVPLEELRMFAEIFGRIKKDYVEPVSDKELLDYAIRGMLDGLDPHSSYLDEDEFKEMQEGTSGEFGGLGIEVGTEDGFIKVIAPIDDTPAQQAGVQAGDLIIRLDDKPVKGLGLSEAVKLMRGKPGSKIKLTISRTDEDKPLVFEITRAIIKQSSVKSRELEPGFGYVRLSQFQAHTTEDMLDAITRLNKKAGGKLTGMVLDLRNNPGGVLNAAVSVSDAFLTKGLVVYTEGRLNSSVLKFKAAPDDVLNGAPLVVLVNGGSASASEIVAGALQDHNRAVVMGQPTFGKGSVQTIVPVNAKVAVKLTTARYFTPKGRSIQAEGIVPDIELNPIQVKERVRNHRRLKESDLLDHLDNPAANGSKQNKKENNGSSLVEEDFVLSEALNLLKGLAILSKAKN